MNPTTPQLIGQGAYGCIYYPSYNCKGKVSNKKNVSKITLDNDLSNSEYDIGKYIKKKIKNYDKFFIIQEHKCKINTNLFLSINNEKCELPIKKSYLMLHSKYLKSKDLSDYIQNYHLSNKQLLSWFIVICKRILILQKIKLIHMDMHFSNILVNENKKLYVIDFGLALNQKLFFKNNQLNLEYLHLKWFSSRLSWESWTLEYNLIGMIVKENITITQNIIKNSIEEYYDSNKKIKFLFPNKNSYIKTSYDFFKKYEKMKSGDIVVDLLRFWDTWDYYKHAIHYTSVMMKQNIKIISFTELLQIMTDPNPTKRFSGENVIKRMTDIFENEIISKKKKQKIQIPDISVSIKTLINT